MKEFLNLDIESLFNYVLKEIRYGWIDTKQQEHFDDNNDDREYHLQTPEETFCRKIGICWDRCELLRYYFENNHYSFKTYLIYLYINDNYCPSHSFLVYKNNGKYIWIEPSLSLITRGIHEYDSEQECLKDAKDRFIKNGFKNNFFTPNDNLSNFYCYEYQKPNYGIIGPKFYNHCRTGRKIKI